MKRINSAGDAYRAVAGGLRQTQQLGRGMHRSREMPK